MVEAAVAFALVCVFAYCAHRGLDWVEAELARSGPSRAKAWEEIGRRK